MRDLYQSIRAHRAGIARALQTTAQAEARAFLQALLAFERHTRGHQHTLDGDEDPRMNKKGASKREETTRTHLAALLNAFSHLTQADWPAFDGLQAILDTADKTGNLEQLALQELRSHASFRNGLPSSIFLHAHSGLFHDGELRITLTAESRRDNLRAVRQLILKMDAPDTLKSARLAIRDGKRALKKLFSGFSTWPEFSQETRDKQAQQRASTALRKFLSELSELERKQLALNWGQYMPSNF